MFQILVIVSVRLFLLIKQLLYAFLNTVLYACNAGHILGRIYNCTKPINRPFDRATAAHFRFDKCTIV